MKTRVIAAAALLPLLFLVIFVLPEIWAAVLVAAITAIGAYELLWRTGTVKHLRLNLYSAAAAAFISLNSFFSFDGVWLQAGILLFWVLIFLELMLLFGKIDFEKALLCIVAGLVIPYFLSALVRILNTPQGRFVILIPFIMAFLSDSGAYFAGRAFGKHKLAPSISPKKTVEGVVGGVAGAILGMVIYCIVLQYFFDFRVNYLYAAIYGLLGSLAAVFGDLCFSVIKRQTGIKDYGNLIPGHGGILDRFDSMVVVAPLAEVLLLLLPLAVKI